MRKYAIRRPKDDDDDKEKVTKPTPVRPSAQPQTTSNTNVSTNAKRKTGITPAPAPAPAGPDATAPAPQVAVDASVSDTRGPDPHLTITERRQLTIENMRRVANAIEAYREANGSYPPRAIFSKGGQPLLSWRVLLLPTLGYQALYEQFKLNEPWDSANNRPLVALIPSVFQSPDRFDERTNYLVPVAGTGAFSGTKGKHPRRWEDGITNTALLFEVDDSRATTWSAPNDLDVNLRQPKQGLGGLRSDGFFVAWGGATINRIDATVSPQDLKAMITVDGGENFSAAAISRSPNATPISTTPSASQGIVQVARANTRDNSPINQPILGSLNESQRNVIAKDSLLSKAMQARDAGLNNTAYRLMLAAYVMGEPGAATPFQWVPALRRPAMAVRFGAGIRYSGSAVASTRAQLRRTGEGMKSSQLSSVIGELADPIFERLDEHPSFLPAQLRVAPDQRTRRRAQQITHVEVLGEGDRATLLQVALRSHVDVLLFFEVSERSTRNNKRSKSVTFSVIDVWRAKQLLRSQQVNYLRRELAQSDALYLDPVETIAKNFAQFLQDDLTAKPIPSGLRASHARKRVVSLAKRRWPDPLGVLAEVRFYRDADLLSVKDQITAYQHILRSEASGAELVAGAAHERHQAIREWIPSVREDAVRSAARRARHDDDDD